MKPRRAYFPEYTMPGVDSPRAKAQAVTFLVGARRIDDLTVEAFAHQFRLKPKTAESLLAIEARRRVGDAK